MDVNEKIFALAENFSASAKILTAISDETRQHLIVEMMKMGHCMGVRVGEITERTNLSRPAVSHHLQIMKDAGIVKVRKEGTKNFIILIPRWKPLNGLAARNENFKRTAGQKRGVKEQNWR